MYRSKKYDRAIRACAISRKINYLSIAKDKHHNSLISCFHNRVAFHCVYYCRWVLRMTDITSIWLPATWSSVRARADTYVLGWELQLFFSCLQQYDIVIIGAELLLHLYVANEDGPGELQRLRSVRGRDNVPLLKLYHYYVPMWCRNTCHVYRYGSQCVVMYTSLIASAWFSAICSRIGYSSESPLQWPCPTSRRAASNPWPRTIHNQRGLQD